MMSMSCSRLRSGPVLWPQIRTGSVDHPVERYTVLDLHTFEPLNFGNAITRLQLDRLGRNVGGRIQTRPRDDRHHVVAMATAVA